MEKYDFSGYATRANVLCSDGRTILKDAFKHNDGQRVPLIWNHEHDDPRSVLGYAVLENRDDGVYAYGTFNDTEAGQTAKLLVQHGDLNGLSIYANQLKQDKAANVMHGNIRELSLVLATANPGAFIESVIAHGEESDEEAYIYSGDLIEPYEETIEHSDNSNNSTAKEEETKMNTENSGDKTIAEIIDTMNEEQKQALYAIVGQALESGDEDEGDDEMKHNVFENDTEDDSLSHADMRTIIDDGKRFGSLKESFLAHADDYGIKDIEWLFPEAKNMNTPPDFISREMDWVKGVMNAVHHTPFSRIKSMFADITEDDARARGYIKGKLKKEEVFSLLKRTTTPQTIYKKQKLDRDDVIDITDFDVVAWLKAEMRMMLDEEIARAVLVGDGRLASSDDKINETNVRPVWTDADLYTIKYAIPGAASDTADTKAKAMIRASIKARKDYKGSGNPVLYTTEDVITDMLLLEDTTGRRLYNNIGDLATAMRVSKIETVPVMENLSRTVDGDTHELLGIIVNLKDYNIGADKGGAINMFDDFDIDYNQQKYLIETRISGALIKPYSAIAIEYVPVASSGN